MKNWAKIRRISLQVCLWLLPILIGTAVSYYFYLISIQARDPRFRVFNSRTILLSGENLSKAPLKIFTSDGREIFSDVTAVTIDFWNEGTKEIRQADILEPIRIQVDAANAEILDFKVVQLSRPLTGLTVSRNVILPNQSLDLNFQILEPKDGGRIQIVYAGPADAPFSVSGAVVDAPKILSFDGASDSAIWLNFVKTVLWCLLGFGALVAVSFVSELLNDRFKKALETIWTFFIVALMLVLILVVPWGCYEGAKDRAKKQFEIVTPFEVPGAALPNK